MVDRSNAFRTAARLAVVGIAAVLVLSAALLLAPARATSAPTALVPASGSSEQWAFGGIASESYSCVNASCFSGGSPPAGTYSIALQYTIEWAVLYTQTNVSATQTMYEAEAALSASFAYALTENTTHLTVSLAGKETAAGFTNVSNVSSVWINAGGPIGPATALGVLNAASTEAFNFSGSATFADVNGSGSFDFDLGANEASAVGFASSLGLVPLDPQPGESWNSSAAYTASGQWTSGYSISESVEGASYSSGNWTSGVVAPSGTLAVNGADLGVETLTDNYTQPPTTTTAQLILLEFGTGAFGAEDGWLFVPSGQFAPFANVTAASALLAAPGRIVAAVGPDQGGASFAANESAFYRAGHGFIGTSGSGNSSTVGESGGPTITVTAGPEPTSVAQQQYAAITSGGAASSPAGFPWAFLVIGVVVAIVVVVGAMGMVHRSRRRRPPAAMPAGQVAPMYAGAAGPTGPPAPTGPAQQAPAGWAAAYTAAPSAIAPPPGPVCPNCGQPGTYVAQYGRYYCATDKAYL